MAYDAPTSSSPPTNLREQLERRWGAMKSERDGKGWLVHWREISDFIKPRRGRFLISDTNKGQKKNQNIVDSTGTVASRTLAAGLMAGMTSPARPWFQLVTQDQALMENEEVKEWLDDTERKMLQVFQASNFYNAMHTLYGELGDFGTACAIILEDYQDVIRLETFTVGEYCLALNQRREADCMYREFQMSVWQVVQEFGLENCCDSTKSFYRNKQYDQWVTVMHAVEPNPQRDPQKFDNHNFSYRSVYWEPSAPKGEQYGVLRQTGFQENPLVAPRWDVMGSDIYGSSPGMEALPDVKELQVARKRKGEAIDRVLRPPVQGGASLRDRYVNMLPGAVNITDNLTADSALRPIYQVNPDLNAIIEDMGETQQRIKQAYFADLFLAISQIENAEPKTAMEIAARKEERLLMLGPVTERLESELLGPAIFRTMAIMLRAGVLLPLPDELHGSAYRVKYLGILAQAQRAVSTGSIERVIGVVGNIAAVAPSVLDKLDTDQVIDEYAQATGVPAKIIRSDEAVAQIRSDRQNAEAAQKNAEMAAQLAPAAKDGATAAKVLSSIDVGGGRSVLNTEVAGP